MLEQESEVGEERLLVAPLEDVGDLRDGLEDVGEVLHDLLALVRDVRHAQRPHVAPRHHVQQRQVVHVREAPLVGQRQQHLRVLHVAAERGGADAALLEVARHELEDVRRQRVPVDDVRSGEHVPRNRADQLAELADGKKVVRQQRGGVGKCTGLCRCR